MAVLPRQEAKGCSCANTVAGTALLKGVSFLTPAMGSIKQAHLNAHWLCGDPAEPYDCNPGEGVDASSVCQPCGGNEFSTGGNYAECKSCDGGSVPNANHTGCAIDACARLPCPPLAMCLNTGTGSFTCTCKAGFIGNGKTGSDIVCTGRLAGRGFLLAVHRSPPRVHSETRLRPFQLSRDVNMLGVHT